MAKKGFNLFERKRRKLTALFAVACIVFLLMTHHSWPEGGTLDRTLDAAGVILVALGVLGRVWSTMYIGGRKNQELVTEGPYSMMRNPLYFFSFLAGLGVSVETGNVYIIAVFVVLFPVYYHYVIKSEEKRLHELFGESFTRYRETTPEFFPNIFKLRLGGRPGLVPELVRKNFMDGAVFFLILAAVVAVEMLQVSGVLRVFWRVP